MRILSPPHSRRIGVLVHDIVEVILQSRDVVGLLDTLQDVEDDAAEAVLIEVDFLAIGDLADLATRENLVSFVYSARESSMSCAEHT